MKIKLPGYWFAISWNSYSKWGGGILNYGMMGRIAHSGSVVSVLNGGGDEC